MPRRSVALIIETSNSYARGVLEGIAQYVRHHERWSMYLPELQRGSAPPQWLASWKGDGIIARIETDEIAEALRKTKLPVVDVSAARILPDIPWVETDDAQIARVAFEHLTERGFKCLAYCGDPGYNWSRWRRDSFVSMVNEAGLQLYEFGTLSRLDRDYSWDREKQMLTKWLQQLPQPIGIFASYDILAQRLLDVCRELNIAVPEQVAVLGVDNDELLCELSDPPLSSVICNTRLTGLEAARLLEQLMDGAIVAPDPIFIAPQGVLSRQSTDILAIDDPDVAIALRFIRQHAFEGINVSDVLQHVPVSRRILENRFQKAIGRTPHQEITRQRMDRIKDLLTETDLPLSEIARRTGFEHDEYLSVFFRKSAGISPSTFRKKARGR